MGKGANHMRLDGQTVLADENFDLKDGHTAPAPGMSGVAGHDINCRCIVVREVMDDAEFFAKTGRHLPERKCLKGMDKTVENAAKDDIIILDEAEKESGALTSRNDPTFKRREAHAKKYYASVRNSDRNSIVNEIV